MSADTATAPAPVADTPDVKNVRDDLGDAVVSKFIDARTMINKYENKSGDKDADEVVPATELLVEILQTVPQDKTRSAGYAEVLLVYGRVLFAFAKRDILRSAILGGDVEAEVLKSQLQDALLKKQSTDVPSKNVEKAKAVPTVAEDGESKVEEKDAEADAPKSAVDESKDDEAKTNGTTKMTTEEKVKEDVLPAEETKAVEWKAEKDTAEGKTDVVEEEKKDSAIEKVNGEPKKSDGGGDSAIVAADEDAIVPVEKASAPTGDAEEDGEEEQEDSNEMLTWEQLEYSRTIFEQLGAAQRHRLPAVFEALGDLLLETDQSEKAAAEYAKALEILVEKGDKSELRVISNLEYQRYIALRKEQPAVALAALKKAAGAFEKVMEASEKEEEKKEFQDILNTMMEEVKAFEAALPASALTEVNVNSEKAEVSKKEDKDEDEDEDVVTIVQPRRRVRKVFKVDSDDDEARPAKKARVAGDGEGAADGGNNGGAEGGEKAGKEGANGNSKGASSTVAGGTK